MPAYKEDIYDHLPHGVDWDLIEEDTHWTLQSYLVEPTAIIMKELINLWLVYNKEFAIEFPDETDEGYYDDSFIDYLLYNDHLAIEITFRSCFCNSYVCRRKGRGGYFCINTNKKS
jgi:hypothetical protein